MCAVVLVVVKFCADFVPAYRATCLRSEPQRSCARLAVRLRARVAVRGAAFASPPGR